MTTWDEAKRRSNLAKHGVDFEMLRHFDWHNAVLEEDDSEGYGEQREKATGLIGTALHVYIYTLRGEEDHAVACDARPNRRSADMSKPPLVPLTTDELAKVEASRREAQLLVLADLESMTDEEDARLTAAAEADPDNPPLTEENWTRMRPAHEVRPNLVRKSLERKRGRPKLEAPKRQVTLRIDPDILEHFKAAGAGWQTAINDALRGVVESRRREP